MYWCILLMVCFTSYRACVNAEKAIIVNPIEVDSKIIPRIVLTLDVSGSMESQKRIYKLRDALRYWIKYQVPDGLKLGMVKFSSSSTMLSNLVAVDKSSREQLIENIPILAQGETCISCGLALAMEILGKKTTGSVIILITDVEESEPSQDVEDMFGKIKETDISVVTISIGSEVILDYIEQLTKISRGLAYSIPDGENVYSDVINALNDTLHIFDVNDTTGTKTIVTNPTMKTMSIIETEILNLTTVLYTIVTTTRLKGVQQETNPSSLPVLISTLSSTNVIETISIAGSPEEDDNESSLPAWALGVIGGLSVIILLCSIFVVAIICLRKRYKIINIQGSYQLSKLIKK